MAHDSQEEETKNGGRNEEDSLVAQMQALAVDTMEEHSSGKKKKPKKKKKAADTKPNENSIAGRTRGKIAEFMKAHPQMRKPKIGVVYDNVMTLHQSHREDHPERPERVMAIYLNLIDKGIYDQLIQLDSDEATEDELLLAHPKAHVAAVMKACMDP